MLILENPVLQRELLVNLRMTRAFVLLFAYVALLGAVVFFAWPQDKRLDLAQNPEEARQLVNWFFLGQYVLMSLVIPSFAAGAFTGEKERQTYEMLLAAPMRPRVIIIGKLAASLCHLAVLVIASLPIVMLCLPLGGVSPYEVMATYFAMAASQATFGMICLTASSYFTRTPASLVVSYLIILPMVIFEVIIYSLIQEAGPFRLVILSVVFPAVCLVVCGILFYKTGKRMLYPPDVGAGAKDVVDLRLEQKSAVGMVIHGNRFPDRLFAPPQRTECMRDKLNPVYDKELRSELFGQGTLMLRLVIQISMFLALPLMAVCCFIKPDWIPWYACYVLVFNVLVGPVFAAGSVTSERERQTLELLLTTTLSPWDILWGKMMSSLRVSLVLTAFTAWPLVLAWFLPPWSYLDDTFTILGYMAVIGMSCLSAAILAMFCSVMSRKTTTAMMSAYIVILLLYAAPLAVEGFARWKYPDAAFTLWIDKLSFASPFAAVFSLPLNAGRLLSLASTNSGSIIPANWTTFFGYLAFYGVLNLGMLLTIAELFNARWRASAEE